MESETMSSPKALFGDLTSTLDQKVAFVEVSEEKLQRSFERLIEIRKQKALLEEKEQSLKVMLTITWLELRTRLPEGLSPTRSPQTSLSLTALIASMTLNNFGRLRTLRNTFVSLSQRFARSRIPIYNNWAGKEGIILNQTLFLVVRVLTGEAH